MEDTPNAALNNKESYTIKQYLAHNPWLQPYAATFKAKITKLAQQGTIWRELDHTVEGRGGAPFKYWTKDLDSVANTLREHARKCEEHQKLIANASAHYLQVAGLRPETVAEITNKPAAPASPPPVQKIKPQKEIRYAVMINENRYAVVQIRKRGLQLIANFISEEAARDYAEWKNLTTV